MLDRRRKRQHSRQDPPGDVQKQHMRPVAPGECACQCETEPEDGVQVDVALGRGQITFLSGEKPPCVPASRACPKGRVALSNEQAMREEVSRCRSTEPSIPTKTGRANDFVQGMNHP